MSLFFAYLSVLSCLGSALASLAAGRGSQIEQWTKKKLRSWPAASKKAEWLVSQAHDPVRPRNTIFVLLGISGASAILAGAATLAGDSVTTDVLPFGLPWLSWHIRLDALSGFFFGLLGLVLFAVSLFGPGYVTEFEHGKSSAAVLGFFTGLFVAGMELVLLADDAFFFLIAWELMSVASYFLVAFHHEHAANRRAAFLYLLMAEIGAIAIILAYGVLAGFAGGFTFTDFREVHLSSTWASIAFVLALIGFGMKAGLVPLHAWLPEAHPVAPSHISALMSGVMLKIAVYGFIRFSFDLLDTVLWQWGVLVLVIGAVSTVTGVLYALMQHDLKRLLAYHSVENIGIIFLGLGLSLIYLSEGQYQISTLALIAALLHSLNHALFKSLLFLGAGTILHQTHEHNVENLGGLIHRMPKLAAVFLIGTVSIAALPPLNGFVSEWLTFQAALQAGKIESGVLRSLVPTAAAVLALAGALTATCFVKVYGVVFLGSPRSRHAATCHESIHRGMLTGPAWLAGLCILFGIFPTPIIESLNIVTGQLMGEILPSAAAFGWFWLTPVAPEVASYSAPLVLIGILLTGWVCYWLLYRRSGLQPRRASPWDCGFGGLNARMQYTSTAFSMPIRRIFDPVFDVEETIDEQKADPDGFKTSNLRYHLHVSDRSWPYLYLPVARLVTWLSRRVGRLQTGNIRTYIAYSFLTLLILLWGIS